MNACSTMVLISLAVNGLLCLLAWRLKWLSVSGALSAIVVGATVLQFSHWGGWLLLLMFFFTSTVLGKIARPIAALVDSGIQKKGGCRDWAQVMANGGLAALAAFYYGVGGGQMALVMLGSALAASTADTWSGEVGIMSHKPPVSIRTFRPVPPGLSGGITWLGTLSGLLGSVLIAVAWYGAFAIHADGSWELLASIVTVAGFCGTLVDSYLGATLQGHYWDPQRKQITEHAVRDGVKLELCRGIRWIDNDVVNLLSNVVAVLIGVCLGSIVL
jgi:uncharacterized protein (TIGR00297 family)